MKKIIAVAAALVMCIAILAGCSSQGSTSTPSSDEKVKVVATIFPQYDFAKQIGGDRADVQMLLAPGAEAHSYEPTPEDIKTIQNADLFVYVGGENDEWVEDILESMGDKAPQTLKLVDCVKTVEEETVEGMQEEHEHADGEAHEHAEGEAHEHEHEHEHADGEEAEIDEHVWTSPKNAEAIVDALCDRMSSARPADADAFKANATEYKKQLEELDGKFRDVVNNANRKTIVFGDRFPLRYFVEEYGLNYYAAFPGCATDTEASADTVAFLINKVKEEKIPVVFSIELSNGKIADTIAESTGAKRLTFYTCHNVSADQMKEGATYMSMMTENVDALRKALA
ncbi:metal ABC transporter substrate-binding protein [Curtanaerobium respiraculi]|uniref:metal ABC transporter substrate-binding protein n=1 Tax=Curtanaerobium respiraculi TaxID=2949669 RepID=UPI0024B385B9|nr:metal ABC transporter substrate-binding protein [Curtanaerobium respiraculi]